MILPKDRDPRFITIRRGRTLRGSDHRLLALWAAACAEHVLHLFEPVHDHHLAIKTIPYLPHTTGSTMSS